MYINGVVDEAFGVSQAKSSSFKYAGGMSKNFLKNMQDQMAGWMQAVTDSKLTSNEIASIEQGTMENLNSADDTSEVLFSDGAAFLKVTLAQQENLNVISSWTNTWQAENNMLEKVWSMFK